MSRRTGEKAGWIGGWTGSVLWAVIPSVLLAVQSKTAAASAGFVLLALAGGAIFRLTPWRYPRVRYLWLMLPLYGLIFALAGLCIAAFDVREHIAIPWYFFVWLLPMLSPLITIGGKRWKDGEPGDGAGTPNRSEPRNAR